MSTNYETLFYEILSILLLVHLSLNQYISQDVTV
jgi:hypothetical protein